jgi:hypothetical protein
MTQDVLNHGASRRSGNGDIHVLVSWQCTRDPPGSDLVEEEEEEEEEKEEKEKEEKEEEEEEEKEGEEEGTEGVKGESRTRGPRKEEVEERIVASVYALSMANVLHSWEHTLNGTSVVAAAVAGHNQREKDGCQVTIPTTSRKNRKKSDDPLAQEQLEEMIRAQMEEEEQVMNSLGDELHVVGSKWELAGTD